MKLLISGAGGLLGSDVRHAAIAQGVPCIGLATSSRDGLLACDITSGSDIAKLDSMEWNALVHTAAWRNPETCEKDPAGAMALNADATGKLAALAAKRSARFLYISTDYVFPGLKPPYAESDPTEPLNTYGQSKLAGEKAAFAAYPSACVLRIPFLYGWRAGLARCAMIDSSLAALKSPEPRGIDDSVVRYPTCTVDVAKAILFILNSKESGIFHFTASDKTTRYKIALLIAELLKIDASKIHALSEPPGKDAKRPMDAHLSMERLKSMGIENPPSFRSRMGICLRELGLLK